jgi:hypothetical protein
LPAPTESGRMRDKWHAQVDVKHHLFLANTWRGEEFDCPPLNNNRDPQILVKPEDFLEVDGNPKSSYKHGIPITLITLVLVIESQRIWGFDSNSRHNDTTKGISAHA